MIDLYTFATANGQRASVMLEECGLPYKAHKVDLQKGEQKSAEFRKLNPVGAIPVIVDADGPGGKALTLSQSGAIVLYLAEKTGKFLPKDPAKRALAFQWFMNATTDLGPGSGVLFAITNFAPDKTAANTEFFEKRLLNYLSNCDRRLGEADYLAGEISIADLALYPVVAVRKALIDKAGGLANLGRWAAAMAARPGVARGMKVPA